MYVVICVFNLECFCIWILMLCKFLHFSRCLSGISFDLTVKSNEILINIWQNAKTLNFNKTLDFNKTLNFNTQNVIVFGILILISKIIFVDFLQ